MIFSLQPEQKTPPVQIGVGSLLAILSGTLWGLATFAAFTLNDNDMPGYPFFYLCCPAIFVCSISMASGKRWGVRGVQGFSVLAFLSMLRTAARHQPLTIFWLAVIFLGTALVVEVVVREGTRSRARSSTVSADHEGDSGENGKEADPLRG